MKINVLKCVVLFLVMFAGSQCFGQKLITYEAGMGTRDPNDADVWILYQRVTARHDGMVFHADSALINNVRNDLTAFGHIKIEVSDTTTIFGDQLYYDGETRVLDIWDDTVRMIDGKTVLKSDHLTYDRFSSIASYDTWGITTNKDKRLTSKVGYYNSDFKSFDIYDSVILSDSNMRIETDTLTYSMRTHIAEYWSPTHVYTDSTTMYSELGTYNTDLRYAHSVKASEVHNGEKHITSDTLIYDEKNEFGKAMGNVVITDTVNNIISTSRYAETDQVKRTSFVTDSALVRFIREKNKEKGHKEATRIEPQEGMVDSTEMASRTIARDSVPVEYDTLYLHADSIFITNDSSKHFQSVMAYRKVKVFRHDAQAMSDSIYYSAPDSLLQMFYRPVIWYGSNQATADTIEVIHDADGTKLAHFKSACFFIEQLDPDKYNQIKGRNTDVFFTKGEPTYADILGNAEMVYYITDDDNHGNLSIIGVNVGIGSDMRIYFIDRAPDRVVTKGNPDMNSYPIDKIEEDKKQLNDFKWCDAQRPKTPMDVFKW